jgi:hypothetical protein
LIPESIHNINATILTPRTPSPHPYFRFTSSLLGDISFLAIFSPKCDFLRFWKTLDDENLWPHFNAVQARNIVPVSESNVESKLILEAFCETENEIHVMPVIERNVLPASGSEVCSLNNSTVMAGLCGVITITIPVRGTATIFFILWKGYFHSLHYTINEFVVTKYAELNEDGQDPNQSLTALALSLCEPFGVSVIIKHYSEKHGKKAFDKSRRPGHVIVDCK